MSSLPYTHRHIGRRSAAKEQLQIYTFFHNSAQSVCFFPAGQQKYELVVLPL